jgi:hypothetical protein
MGFGYEIAVGSDFKPIWDRFSLHFGVQNRFKTAVHIDMPTRYETLPLTSLISIQFERAPVIRDIQF